MCIYRCTPPVCQGRRGKLSSHQMAMLLGYYPLPLLFYTPSIKKIKPHSGIFKRSFTWHTDKPHKVYLLCSARFCGTVPLHSKHITHCKFSQNSFPAALDPSHEHRELSSRQVQPMPGCGFLSHLPPHLWVDTNTSYCPAAALHWQRCFSKPHLWSVGTITPLHPQDNPKSTRQAPGILWDCCLTYNEVRQWGRNTPEESQVLCTSSKPGNPGCTMSCTCTAASHKKAANGLAERIMLLHPKIRAPARSRKTAEINYSIYSELDLRKKHKKKVNDKKIKPQSPESADTLFTSFKLPNLPALLYNQAWSTRYKNNLPAELLPQPKFPFVIFSLPKELTNILNNIFWSAVLRLLQQTWHVTVLVLNRRTLN